MNILKKGFAVLTAAFVIGSGIGPAVSANAEESAAGTKKITILHTNDSHGRAVESDNDGMGFAKISTLVKKFESENPNTLLLDAGDTFHGTNFATLNKGDSIAEIMNKVGYDGMAAGNHDFNYGYQRLLELEKKVVFPVLSANVKKQDGTRLLKPYEIKEVDGIKLGIFGLSTPETHYKTHPKNVEGLTFTDPAAEAREMVKELKAQNVDAIIAVTHLGIDESSTDTSIKVAKEAPGIDLIVDGHSHSVLVEGLKGENDTLIVSAGEYTKNLGTVELTFDGKKIVSKTAKLIKKEETADIVPDPAVEEVIKKIQSAQEEILSQVIGKTAVKLDGEREQVRGGETNLGNLITDAMVDVTGADMAITNGGGIRASIDAGDITKGDVITVLPFGNYIVTKKLKGLQIKAGIENGVSAYPDVKGAFPHVSGLTFAIDPSQPAGSRVHSMKIDGKAVDMNKEYVVATNDFMAAGGDEYTSFNDSPILNEYQALDEALINYIQKIGTVNAKVEGRVVSAPLNEDKPVDSKPAPKIYWDGLLMKKGQIGRVVVKQPINLWKRDANDKLTFVRVLKVGEQYRVYRYDNKYFGQYGLGGGYYVTNMEGYIGYETPSKKKLAQLMGQ
ncbi:MULTISPECIES: bifunctional metallophosphatase/5'-nucleotidase [Bacillus]|uniref:Multifunctional 2',3'-cyclic-nucleotide 2'-phosphodiesterase/5'-nucleotidase/3'-nucleotidase n=1 Tax=Bacillus infantis TaxID=324767 RepID=A0A5D4SK14_9BACI|nr:MULTISPECIES: 5'-nucleotidase C-terminal domain-containing protein [Bacillus]MCP1160552.1 5'-nucleotidase C-terminal domain-containing protein [Bacillus infantis]PLR73667.1 multifunctional 2',3'-cyclic-nucleotide 2'-phosphodiesterase/5'-nucleotidase/3'-nucleotidase [Bacillus sp. UMB0728]TYS63805.1 multifunctional 2',3'-cyclic-nucleotide 2'-phosphodiesterase/5'-nucleotidase/3'-nucleotidase [Bacillus infantis]